MLYQRLYTSKYVNSCFLLNSKELITFKNPNPRALRQQLIIIKKQKGTRKEE